MDEIELFLQSAHTPVLYVVYSDPYFHNFTVESIDILSPLVRMDEFRYTLSRQLHKQSPMALLGPEEVAEMVPFMNMDNIHGGLYTPNEVTLKMIILAFLAFHHSGPH